MEHTLKESSKAKEAGRANSKDTFGKKRGNKLGFWFFKIFLKLFGLSGAYALLHLVCLYYLIFDRTAFSASMAYINKRYRGRNILIKTYFVYKLFVNQGKSLVDRYYVVSGQGEFDFEVEGYSKIEKLLKNSDKGIILLTAHVGNWQVTMTGLEKLKKTIYLLMRPEDNIAVKNTLNIYGKKSNVEIISSKNFLGSAVKITEAINKGGVVSIMGDRPYESDSVEVNFLGERAFFPYSAFRIAAAVQSPVVVLLSAKISTKKYILHVTDIIEPKYSSVREKRSDIQGWVQDFAKTLEDYVSKYPLQWFVFHNIWANNKNLNEHRNGKYGR